ncbi:hypothetical protein [Streptomyces diastaticus]|uniref:hypothetical protein n=1 Tax=Streptomyces diastaticus TaxID=1956 RepID=UPI003F4CC9BF
MTRSFHEIESPFEPGRFTRTFTTLLRKAGLRRIRFHDLRHSTATVYAHVRLRLQRDAIDTLSTALDGPANDESTRDDGGDPPLCGATVH